VTDLTHDGSEDGFHEIQLSGKQLVFLFMATTVVSVVIFLCGVLVGRSVRIDRPPELTDPAATVTPAPSDTVAEAAPAATEPPVPADEGETPLSYKQRLESDKAPTEAIKQTDAPKPVETSKPATPAPAAVREPDPPRPAPSQKTERSPATSRDGWVVQLVALRDRQTANSIVQRLSGKGYPAFLVSPTPGAPAPVFKVQVGRYADRDQAEQIRRRLEKEEQFKPWISR
jgi:cell division septation protein DedD